MSNDNGGSKNGSGENLWSTTARLWRVRNSGMAVATTLGEMVSGRILKFRRDKFETGFYLDPADIGKGAGRLMAAWLRQLHPTRSVDAHFVALGKALQTLDETCHLPLELAMARYLASKIMLALEGFNSRNAGEEAYYETFQNEAKRLLRITVPDWRRATRRDVYLGLPFEGEALFGLSLRMLDALTPADRKADLRAFLHDQKTLVQSRSKNGADFAQALIAMTYGREDDTALEADLERWFERYRDFKLKEIDRQQHWIKTGMAAMTGQLPWSSGKDIWQRLFSKKQPVTVEADVVEGV